MEGKGVLKKVLDNLITTIIVGKRGVITLPAKMREVLGLNEGTPLKVVLDGGEITISVIGEEKA